MSAQTFLFIGGTPIPKAKTAIEAALNCILIWPETPRSRTPTFISKSIETIRPAAVFIYIKCISHEASALVFKTCRANSIPCIKLTSGYSPNQVLHQLEKQAPNLILEKAK
jgi:hypothetical protein